MKNIIYKILNENRRNRPRSISQSLLRRINEINEMIDKLLEKDIDVVYSYGGSTIESSYEISKKITIKNQFVYISMNNKMERFNTNNQDGLLDLKYELRYLKSAIKQELRYL